MATITEVSDDYVARLNRETELLNAETRRLMAEASKLQAQRSMAMAKTTWLDRLGYSYPGLFMVFCLVLAIAIIGLGAALAKAFLI